MRTVNLAWFCSLDNRVILVETPPFLLGVLRDGVYLVVTPFVVIISRATVVASHSDGWFGRSVLVMGGVATLRGRVY